MEWEPERLRELAAIRAGDGPSGSAYDPELLEALTDAADEIERLRRKIQAVERLTQTATIDSPHGASLRLQSIRAELGISANDPRIAAGE